jgi:hypothetical protein
MARALANAMEKRYVDYIHQIDVPTAGQASLLYPGQYSGFIFQPGHFYLSCPLYTA